MQLGGMHIDDDKWNNAEGGHARFQACTLDQAVSLHTSTGHRRTSVTVSDKLCVVFTPFDSNETNQIIAKVASGSEDEEVVSGRTGRSRREVCWTNEVFTTLLGISKRELSRECLRVGKEGR